MTALRSSLHHHGGRRLVLAPPMLWLLALTAIPALIILQFSISQMEAVSVARPWSFADGVLNLRIDFSKYLFLFSDPLYISAYLSSVKYALISTMCCLLLGYPFAWFMARSPEHMRPLLLMAVMLPFWTSFLIRIYSWKGLLANNGVFNNLMIGLGIIQEPIAMLHTPFSLTLGMVYTYLPFMILPLYANLQKLDVRLLEAAADLGAPPWKAFWLVTVPLSKNGILAGSMLVFIPSVGEYVIPELLGGPETLMIGRVLWDEFFGNNDWTMASAVAVVMILLILIPMALFNQVQERDTGGQR
ncbi:ABC transporter permease subunit [Massilia sp. BSC265]|uniref:ABC transporter permease subunit n=1 Tax=Massilia sp. BSC265 TaxID=1549812 RepID=UPI0004E86E93|nr:ABC transporter permease subunit [Massilia sp. BSC265]KFI05684.1 spermidine/putrescine ABC transporter permease [Massilia sp. BSC265]